jgi:proton-dependent oligopeptide transporter, POT family
MGQVMNDLGAKEFLGQPRGLAVLFFTEMWERFTYYGMRAILILFLTDAVRGGFGLSDSIASSIYGLYICGTYILCLPGGWVADRLIGARRAVRYGGLFIIAGNALLALGATTATFYAGLILIVLGVGLLKPNVSTMVGDLYPEGGGRRDAGFTVFYMGINLGAFIGPIIVGWLAVKYGWRAAFSAGAVGMSLGLLQFHYTQKYLGTAGLGPTGDRNDRGAQVGKWVIGGVLATIALGYLLALTGGMVIDPKGVADNTLGLLSIAAALYFLYMFFFAGLDATEKKRLLVILYLFIGCAFFWAGFEQTGSSLNLFAERFTDRHLSSIDFMIPTGWFQSINSIFILMFGAPFSMLWVWLAKRQLDPSAPVKFALGLILLGLGFLFMVWAANIVAGGQQAMPHLLVLTYLMHTYGELCLSPVGLSSVTKLAPKRFVSQMMGVWFLATSIGNLSAGVLAGMVDTQNPAAMPGQYLRFFYFLAAAGLVALIVSRPVKKLMSGAE